MKKKTNGDTDKHGFLHTLLGYTALRACNAKTLCRLPRCTRIFCSRFCGHDGERLTRYLNCLRESFDDEAVGPRVPYVVFSDSIVLTTEEDSESALQILIRRCSRALGLMLQNEIPLRGAI